MQMIVEKIKQQMEDRTTDIYSFIRTMLKSMLHGARKMQSEILDALSGDLRLDESSAYLLSIYPFIHEVQNAFEKLREWYYLLLTTGESRKNKIFL